MPIYEEYFSLYDDYCKKYGDHTVLLMQVGSFFEVYGLVKDDIYFRSNIEDFATMNDLKIANKSSKYKGEQVVMSGFTLSVADKYIEKTVNENYTVVVYVQDEVDNTVRKFYRMYSPGTSMYDSSKITNNVSCIWLHRTKFRGEKLIIGVSSVDVYTGKSDMYEFETDCLNYPSSYDDLERYLMIMNPIEIILIHNLDETIVSDIVQYTNIQDKKKHYINVLERGVMNDDAKKCEQQIYQREIINNFFKCGDDVFFNDFMVKTVSTQSLCFLLHFVQCHNPSLVDNIQMPHFTNVSNKLILANHSLKQLNIISDKSGKYSCVLNLLNQCTTAMGKRFFKEKFLNPDMDAKTINKSYEMTEYWIKHDISVKSYLKSMIDFEKCVRQIYDNNFSISRCTKLHESINKCIEVSNELKEHSLIMKNVNSKLNELCETITSYLKYNLNLDKCNLITKHSKDYLKSLEYTDLDIFPKGSYSKLDSLYRTNIDSMNQLKTIKNYFNTLVANHESKSKTKNTEYIKLNTTKTSISLVGTKRRVNFIKEELIRIQMEYELDMSNDETCGVQLEYLSPSVNEPVKLNLDLTSVEYVANGSKKDLHITSKQIRQIQANIDNFRNEYVEELYNCIQDFFTKLKTHTDDILIINDFVKYIDLTECKKSIAINYNYCKPEIKKQDKSFIDCKGLRHPLIEHINQKELYVDNDIDLDTLRGMLIFGTNAVGKTSLIKSVGISLIMAQAGLYVPCSKFVYSPYEYIFTRILGNDNLFKGLSTFAVEMCELRTILKLSNKNSLVLGDEVCSGTESSSAVSIFMTTLEELYKNNSTFIFATHFHDIKNYSELEELDKVKMFHMAVKFNRAENILVYNRKLVEGPGESMYGLEVCKSLNLSDPFLKRAHELRVKYNAEETSQLTAKKTHYNSLKLKTPVCEICKRNISDDIHHLQHQKRANSKGFIDGFHKNHAANLVSVCKKCHDNFHSDDTQYRKMKTTEGYQVSKC